MSVPAVTNKSNLNSEDVFKVEQALSGESSSSGRPNLPVMHLIELIRKAERGNKDGKSDDWAPFVNEELRHLRTAVYLLKSYIIHSFIIV